MTQMERYTIYLDWKNKYCEKDCTIQSKSRLSEICIKVSVEFCTALEQNILQFLWKRKRPPIAKAILKKKNGAWRDQAS